MFGTGKRLFAATAVLGFAAAFVGVGIRFSMADEPKAADLADLRDAIKAADKRGDNVDEVAKALDALDKALAKGLKPEAGKTPAELTALRQAVEAAARKGENVEEITKQLEAVEMKLVGRVLTAPKPVTPPLGDAVKPKPRPVPRPFPNDFQVLPPGNLDIFPNFDLGNVDPAAIQKAMDLRTKALEQLLANPQDRDALKKAIEANQEFLKALTAGRGGIVAPDLIMPNFGGGDFGGGLGAGGFGRVPDRFRLGVRMEKLSPVVVEQLGIEAGRGITITEVITGSAAEKAGFKANDIVLEFAGKPVSDLPEDFNHQVTAVKAGEKVDAVVLRKGKKVELKGIELPDMAQPARLLPRPPLPERIKPAIPSTLPDLGPKPDVLPGGGNTMSFSLNNGEFTIKAIQNGIDYVITGTQDGANRVINKVTITDAGKTVEAATLDKVPEAYRGTVEKLVNNNRVVKSRVKD